MFFPPRYSGFPIHPLGCLELEAFLLFQGRIQNKFCLFFSFVFLLLLLINLYSKAQHALSLSPSAPPSPYLSLSLFCSICFTSHNIHYITPVTCHCHANNLVLHVTVMPTIFQAPNKLQKLNQNKISLFLTFFIIFNHLSVV